MSENETKKACDLLVFIASFNLKIKQFHKSLSYLSIANELDKDNQRIKELLCYNFLQLGEFEECRKLIDSGFDTTTKNMSYILMRLNLISGEKEKARENIRNYLGSSQSITRPEGSED